VTITPSSDFGIRGHEGKAYDVNERCAAPGCGELSRHTHHMWARSYLIGQPKEWVQLPDGTVIGNRIGLCVRHHNDVTGMVGGHRARIVFSSGVFWWEDRLIVTRSPSLVDNRVELDLDTVVWKRTGPLVYQPPGIAPVESEPEEQKTEEEVCPSCGKAKHPKRAPLPPRKAKTWSCDVPDDSEIGADVLDGWVQDIAEILGFEDERSRLRRYHALSVALFWVMQNKTEFEADIKEAATA
jgi:hypothetical protein